MNGDSMVSPKVKSLAKNIGIGLGDRLLSEFVIEKVDEWANVQDKPAHERISPYIDLGLGIVLGAGNYALRGDWGTVCGVLGGEHIGSAVAKFVKELMKKRKTAGLRTERVEERPRELRVVVEQVRPERTEESRPTQTEEVSGVIY